MDREKMQAIFSQPRNPLAFIADFCRSYPEFMSVEPIGPEFLAPKARSPSPPVLLTRSTRQREELSAENRSALSNAVSVCSNFSRLTVNKVIYRDILQRRKEHAVFSALQADEEEGDRLWYYTDEKQDAIVGPLTAAEMDQRFQLEALQENTRVKKKFEDEYYPLSTLVKRYYKNVVSEQLDLQKGPAPLSEKLVNFRKGETMLKKTKEREVFEHKNREERFFSHAVRPQLDLKNMLPAAEDEDENEPYSRLRANTLNQNAERPRFNTNAEAKQRSRFSTDAESKERPRV